jgi:hypothetical protein
VHRQVCARITVVSAHQTFAVPLQRGGGGKKANKIWKALVLQRTRTQDKAGWRIMGWIWTEYKALSIMNQIRGSLAKTICKALYRPAQFNLTTFSFVRRKPVTFRHGAWNKERGLAIAKWQSESVLCEQKS